jgi:hypothetical protein
LDMSVFVYTKLDAITLTVDLDLVQLALFS